MKNKKFHLIITVLFIFFPPIASIVFASGELYTQGTQFMDVRRGVVLLRGLNVTADAKVPPFTPITKPELLEPLAEWGVSVIRLLFNWEAFEPMPGVYNMEYLHYYTKVVNWAWEKKLYVIIDIHQDAFSRFQVNGCGDGFPGWAIPANVNPDAPDNGTVCKSWGSAMIFDLGMHTCWHHFYTNDSGVRSRFLKMVDVLASHFSGFPGVIGYDLLNEPWGDEEKEIAPLYEEEAIIIRSRDPAAILFVCPHALVSSGLIPSNLPRMSFDNYVFSPHTYDAILTMTNFWIGISPMETLQNLKSRANEWDVPLFLGEFGSDASAFGASAYIDLFYHCLDKLYLSGAQWNFTPGWTADKLDGWNGENFSVVDDKGNIRGNYRIRPYPKRIAGIPVNFEVNRKSSGALRIVLEWEHNPLIGETRIFAPRNKLFDNKKFTIEESGWILLCYYEDVKEQNIVCTSPIPGKKKVIIQSKNY